jgi:hypothetical protein
MYASASCCSFCGFCEFAKLDRAIKYSCVKLNFGVYSLIAVPYRCCGGGDSSSSRDCGGDSSSRDCGGDSDDSGSGCCCSTFCAATL